MRQQHGRRARAAAFDERISALICIDGLYDFGAAYTKPLGLGQDAAALLRAEVNEQLDALLAKAMTANSMMRWSMRQGMWAFGAKTPRAFLAATLDYNLRDGIAERIQCPVLVAKAESDEFFAGQPEQLLEHLGGQAEMITFTDTEGAGSHCHIGAQRLYLARMLDWLDNQFKPEQ